VPGFRAVIPFKEGILRTIAWFDEDAGRRTVNPEVNRLMDTILAVYDKVF